LKEKIQSLLPKKAHKRVAQYYEFSKIKPKVLLKSFSVFKWFMAISFISVSLLGYYPTFSIPPIKKSQVWAETNEQKAEILPSSFDKALILPHPGYLSTPFSNYHPGIDIASGLGMPIHPIIDGEATEVGFDIFGLGNYVVISHQNDFKSKYAHMGKIYVKKGDKVTQENILGEVGLTGRTSGPHTHLEITRKGEYIDPQKLLPELSNMPASRGEPKN
jgi:murein DD-endopeptidase MepM/ murein hydrolase activator NlpD